MDITAQQRAHLADALTHNLGEEASNTLMAHLPVGGADSLATKADLARLGDELRADIGRCATKDDLQRFATKADLNRLVDTVGQLNTDVNDLRRQVTMAIADTRVLRIELTAESDRLRTDLTARSEQLHMQLAEETNQLRTELAAQANELRTEWHVDLNRYIGRQTLIQVATLLTIILASLAYITYVVPPP